MKLIMSMGGWFHNLHKLAKMAIFTKKTPFQKKKTQLKGFDPALQVLNKMAHGYPSKSKMRSHFITQFMMNKTTFHTHTKGGGGSGACPRH